MAERAVIEEARALRAAGFHVIALRAHRAGTDAAKQPLCKGWRERPPTDEELFRALESSLSGGIGFPGGELNNNIVPLDFDDPKAEAWWIKQSTAAGIDPRDYPTSRTPGKVQPDGSRRPGSHIFVTDVRGVLGNAEGQLKHLGINIRGHGHVVLPPSPHPHGGNYQWVEGHSLLDFLANGVPPCPDGVYQAIEAGKPKAESKKSNGAVEPITDDERIYDICRTDFDKAKWTVAKEVEHHRNETLNKEVFMLATKAHYHAYSEGEVRESMRDACIANGWIPKWGDKAFDPTFDSAWRAGLREPHEIELKYRPRYNGDARRKRAEEARQREEPGFAADATEAQREPEPDGETASTAGGPKTAANGNAKPDLIVDPSDFSATAHALRDLMAADGAFFDRGMTPVQVAPSADGGPPAIMQLNLHSVVVVAHGFCRPVRSKANGFEPVTLPDRVAKLYLEGLAGEWRLQPLAGICTCPLLAADGAIRFAEGYDPASQL